MSLNRQESESGFSKVSPSMDMLYPYSLVAHAHQSKPFARLPRHGPVSETTCSSEAPELEAESPFSRQDRLSPVSSGFPVDAEMNADQELPPRPEAASGDQCASNNPQDWYPYYTASLQYFVDQGQHSPSVQAVAAFLNIRLPYQRLSDPVSRLSNSPSVNRLQTPPPSSSFVSLRPYIRRLIVTGHDTPSALRAFFGDNWEAGLGAIFREERVNYLFMAKSGGWASTKAAYDISPDEQTPFLRALRDPTEDELREAEGRWSEWLAMEDWMVGPRSPW